MEDQIEKLISLVIKLIPALLTASVVVAMARMAWRQNQKKHHREVKERLIDSSTVLVSGKKVTPEQKLRITFDLDEYTKNPCAVETYRRILRSPFEPRDLEHFRKAGHLIELTHDERIIKSTIGWWGIRWRLLLSLGQFLISMALATGGVYLSIYLFTNEEILSEKRVEAVLAAQVYIFVVSVFFASSGMLSMIRRVERMHSLKMLLKRAQKRT